MPSQDEKAKRKQILAELARKQQEKFDQDLPASREMFQGLFDFLDQELEECDDTLKQTKKFLSRENIANADEVTKWLEEHGAYCDCEVLANVEEQFN